MHVNNDPTDEASIVGDVLFCCLSCSASPVVLRFKEAFRQNED